MSAEKTMPEEVRRQCFELRCRSKRGGGLTPAELRQCERWHAAYPEQYRALDREIFEATKPFGATR